MPRNRPGRVVMRNRALVLTGVALLSFVFLPMTRLWAQQQGPANVDLTPPAVDHEPYGGLLPPGETHLIFAFITDETSMGEVTLFYRPKGAVSYSVVPMYEVEATEAYTAEIPGEAMRQPGVEYYIRATDRAGNELLRGDPSSPLVLKINPLIVEPATESVAVAPSEQSKKTDRKGWVWVLLGAVAVGTAALALGGGGGGGGGGDDQPVSPSGGTVSIIAPTPQ